MYWKVTVERPDGAGGWTLVGVYGTDDSPVTGTGRHLHGDTPADAAQLLLSHVWPIDLAAFNRYEGTDRWAVQRKAKTGIADHRLTVEASDRRWHVPPGTTRPEPWVVTVAELRLMSVRKLVTESVAAAEKAAELAKQAQSARLDARYARHRIEDAVEEAKRAGVDAGDLTKAKRKPRRTKKGE